MCTCCVCVLLCLQIEAGHQDFALLLLEKGAKADFVGKLRC
jgi:hypothetical protein